MPNKMKMKSKTPKKVTRQFLFDLANTIYNSKTKKYLRLCNGTLQNGPDHKGRTMHCGLGELYFAVTGRHPRQDRVHEGDVINLVVERSTLPQVKVELDKQRHLLQKRVTAAIKKLKIPGGLDQIVDKLKESLIENANDVILYDYDVFDAEELENRFRQALDDIQEKNDDCVDDTKCSIDQYRARSKRVAQQLRYAGSLLPK